MIRRVALLAPLLALSVAAPPSRAEAGAPPTHAWAFTSREALDARFAPPAGFARASVDAKSFAAFLRTLPLAPPDAPVVDYRGAPLWGTGHHPNVAAVVDIDVGARDLQQCADAVIRMHAEWRWGTGDRELAYHATGGALLSYEKWLAGERMVTRGGTTELRDGARAPRKDDHAALRAWLDEVFAWANTSSLAREGETVSFADVRGGDFFVLPGSPFGHAVLVLDVARDARGRTALLLGQSYMPAQSFQVLRPSANGADGADGAWFVVEPGARAVATPFWRPFPMESLRRMR